MVVNGGGLLLNQAGILKLNRFKPLVHKPLVHNKILCTNNYKFIFLGNTPAGCFPGKLYK
jgi:hypothetical protein